MAASRFKQEYSRRFRKKSLDQMKLVEKRKRSLEKSIVNLQRGRSFPLGNGIDKNVRKYMMALPYK